jgi:very-short-patch-repair endonuclease
LRSGQVRGWIANYRIPRRGNVYYLDIAFPRLRVAIEIDGLLHERNLATFENDRRRQNDLVLAGWSVLRFTWRMLVDEQNTVLATVRAALARAQH